MAKDFTIEKRQRILEKYGGCCAYCGNPLTLKTMQVDHIIPLYRKTDQQSLSQWGRVKGTHIENNLNPSCRPCNASKSTFTLEGWREEILKKQDRAKRDSATFRLLLRFNLVELQENKVVFYFESYGRG